LKSFTPIGWSLFAGLLLFAAWPISPLFFLVFVAFCPLLYLAESSHKKSHFFWLVFFGLLVWNGSTTWWIWNSTDIGSVAAIIANSLLMCIPWIGYFSMRKKMGKGLGYLSLISFWMLFEYIHLNWQLSWPWLTLGNVFASHPEWVQWYEFTGVSGGTLWVLLTNILVWEIILSIRHQEGFSRIFFKSLPILLITLALSSFHLFYFIDKGYDKPLNKNVVMVQPNIDPYQKFNQAFAAEQIATMIQLSEKQIDSNTALVLWPETALSVADWQNHVRENPYYQSVFEFVNRYPNLALLSGVETFKAYTENNATPTARKGENGSFYDAFNAAVYIRPNEVLQFYNKSKLVPGVESLPTFLNFLGPVFEQFGGTTGGYGRSSEAAVFASKKNPYLAAPVICYESIYGEYVSSYVAKGANMLAIITNDGWWGNTPGHKQHLDYARLRAIETRRWVARSANTGISAVIDNRGNMIQTLGWDKAGSLKYPVQISTELTFYTKHGDWLYQIMAFLAGLILIYRTFLMVKDKISA
jgi:apolipoprotein N-acyltransferase